MYDNHSIVPKCDEVNFTVFKFVQTIELNTYFILNLFNFCDESELRQSFHW